jgi:hypothetical protein
MTVVAVSVLVEAAARPDVTSSPCGAARVGGDLIMFLSDVFTATCACHDAVVRLLT